MPRARWRQRTLEDYLSLAKRRNLKYLSKHIPPTTHDKGRYQCLICQHKFRNRFDVLQSGGGCPRCGAEKTGRALRRTEADYRKLAKKLNLVWVGPPVRRVVDPTGWKCITCNEVRQRSYSILSKSNYGCYQCHKQIQMFDTIFHLKYGLGIKLVGQMPLKAHDSTDWMCEEGHPFHTSIDNIKQDRWCTICGREKTSAAQRLKDKDYHSIAKLHGFTYLGPLPPNNRTKTWFKCRKGHEFEASYDVLSRGPYYCPHANCRGEARSQRQRSSEQKYIAAGKKYGWKYLGPLPNNQQLKTNWLCPKRGHGKFSAPLKHVQYGHGCSKCGDDAAGDKERATPEEYKALAKANRCDWIGKTIPKRAALKTKFRCWGENRLKKRHVFKSSYLKLLGHRRISETAKVSVCSKCTSLRHESKPELRLFNQLKGLGRRYREVREGRWKIDIVLRVPGLKIAIEYDSWHFHHARLDKDRRKRRYLRKIGYLTLRIKGNQEVPSCEALEDALTVLLSGTCSWVEIQMPDWRTSPANYLRRRK